MRRFPPFFLLPAVVLLVGACINVPDVQQVVEEPDAGAPALQVRLELSRTHTKGSVDVTVELSRQVPQSVELLLNGHVVANLLPPYKLRMETQDLKEGTHEMFARVVLDSGVALSEPRQLTVDRTAPTWASRKPLPNARFVPVNSEVQAVFSEALDPATVNASTVQLFVGAEATPANVSLSSAGTVVSVKPSSRFPVDVRVKVTVGAAVTDLAGNALQPETEEWSWVFPGFIPLGDPLLSDSRTMSSDLLELQVDGEDRPVVAWAESSQAAVYVRRWSGERWEQLGSSLKASPTANIWKVGLRMGVDGQPVVAWGDAASATVHVRRWDGTTWGAIGNPIQGPRDFSFYELGMDGSGRWLVGGMAPTEGQSRILMWQWLNGQWEPLDTGIQVDLPNRFKGADLLLHGAKNPILIWGEGRDYDLESVRIQRRDGETWKAIPPRLLTLSGGWNVDGEGRLLHALNHAPEGGLWREEGGSWSPVGPVVESPFPGGLVGAVGRLVFDSAGMPVVLMSGAESPGQTATLYVCRLRDGKWERMGGLLRPQLPDEKPAVRVLGLSKSGKPFLMTSEHKSFTLMPARVYVPNE
ncbi:Ig-like domain-containing protein [Myxococcus landrumensis]|uniref:Ig-like domain-containing protein n=1 Tax=Myxococcus landrumensis TaxID=2813577 RepID=A0ABX7N199_9BACT|nr:Ig-like domain-containing protein [Myxococcus landrumus]QSQ11470.1 Ig-like domain-containing protein [Myxococcus landrumus]